jgi:hypothetical protein
MDTSRENVHHAELFWIVLSPRNKPGNWTERGGFVIMYYIEKKTTVPGFMWITLPFEVLWMMTTRLVRKSTYVWTTLKSSW